MLCVEWHSTNTLHQYAIYNHNDKTPNSEDKPSTNYIVLFDMKSSEQDTCLKQTFISSLSVFFIFMNVNVNQSAHFVQLEQVILLHFLCI